TTRKRFSARMHPIGAEEISVVTAEGSRAILSGRCPVCAGDRDAEILAEDTLEEEDKASGVWASSTIQSYAVSDATSDTSGSSSHALRMRDLEDDPETGEPFWAV